MKWFSRFFGRKKKKAEGEDTSGDVSSSEGALGVFESPLGKLTPEREEEMINSLARKIHKFRIETPTILMLETMKPANVYASYFGLLPMSPLLEVLGIRGFDYVSLFLNRENVDRLIDKLEEYAEK